jgi:hypothetical protein
MADACPRGLQEAASEREREAVASFDARLQAVLKRRITLASWLVLAASAVFWCWAFVNTLDPPHGEGESYVDGGLGSFFCPRPPGAVKRP